MLVATDHNRIWTAFDRQSILSWPKMPARSLWASCGRQKIVYKPLQAITSLIEVYHQIKTRTKYFHTWVVLHAERCYIFVITFSISHDFDRMCPYISTLIIYKNLCIWRLKVFWCYVCSIATIIPDCESHKSYGIHGV